MKRIVLAALAAAVLTTTSSPALAWDVQPVPDLGGAVLFGTGAVLLSVTSAAAGTGLSAVQLVYIDEPDTPGLVTAGFASSGLNLATGAAMMALALGADAQSCTAFCRLGASNLAVGLVNLATSAVLVNREPETSSTLTVRPVFGWEGGATRVGVVVAGF